jgi:hypothetical protein
MSRKNRISIKMGYSTDNATYEEAKDSAWRESARGSIVLTGVVESYDGTTKIAYIKHRSGEIVKALNLSGVGLSGGDDVSYMLDDTGDYAVLGKKP